MKTLFSSLLLLGLLSFQSMSLKAQNKPKNDFLKECTEFAVAQTEKMLQLIGEPNGRNYPRTMNEQGKLVTTGMYDWTPGFFPGSLWYLYELTGDPKWKTEARKWTVSLERLKTFTGHHGLGFMMYCSYGNAERLASEPSYKDILVESAGSLASRFSERTRTIKSWNYRKAWNGTTEWFYPVIIDNMMNLEMLFYASRVSGDNRYRNVAVTHAESTLKNHFRKDFTTYHVVNYDTLSGKVLNQATCQGYSDNSTWSRGQAWAIYGYTMVYRETGNKKFLSAAEKAVKVFLKQLPEDLIPAWDFNAGKKGYMPEGESYAAQYAGEELRDVSAAAITCSALFELGELTGKKKYVKTAVKMLHSLASPAYMAPIGGNACFLLEHSVGSLPHRSEIDKPLVYADYYFLEALCRYKRLAQ